MGVLQTYLTAMLAEHLNLSESGLMQMKVSFLRMIGADQHSYVFLKWYRKKKNQINKIDDIDLRITFVSDIVRAFNVEEC